MKWSVGKIMSKRALWTPERTAVVYEDVPITYGALNDEVNQFAHFLQQKGLKKGDRMAVNLFNCPEFLVSYFAAAKLGIIFVPLNYRLVSQELAYQLNRCGCRLLLFHDDTCQEVAPIRSSVTVEADKFVWLKSFGSDTVAPPKWAIDYHKAIDGNPKNEPVPDTSIDLDDPLLILYTSGVTGDPKGAVVSHGQTYFKNFQYIILTDMREDDVFLSQAPLCHSAGLAVTATPALCRGALLLMRKKFDAQRFGLDIETYRATIVFGLTTMLRFVLETGVLDRVDLDSVRILLGGGERTPTALFNALAEIGLYLQMGFGQTENSGMTLVPKESVLQKKGSCGFSNFFTEVWVEDDKGQPLPPGEIGNIVATGPNVMSGYWDMPDQTAATIQNDKLFTGDLGYTDEEGFLYIADRAKDMYRSGGENVYPAEVERVLSEHPKIEYVAIIGVPDDKWGETGKAFIVCRDGQSMEKGEVFGFLEGKVARFKFPAHIEFVDSLPLSAWGKVKKGELNTLFHQ